MRSTNLHAWFLLGAFMLGVAAFSVAFPAATAPPPPAGPSHPPSTFEQSESERLWGDAALIPPEVR
jgi:hypothetical protein